MRKFSPTNYTKEKFYNKKISLLKPPGKIKMSVDELVEKYKTNLWAEFCMKTEYKERLGVIQKYRPSKLLKELEENYNQNRLQAWNLALPYQEFWNNYLKRTIRENQYDKISKKK